MPQHTNDGMDAPSPRPTDSVPRRPEGAASVEPQLREWFDAQLKAGLPAFAGSAVAGTLAVRTDLINEFIGRWLYAPADPGTAPPVDVTALKPLVKSVTLRAETGAVLVDFEVAV